MNASEDMKQIAQEVAVCTRCSLQYSRKLAVPGEGPLNAEIMFIGEGPGFYENEQGRPFVGPSGKFLDDLLASIHIKRVDVFIGNVIKCRPPGNRDPLPEELAACREYLERQIQIINPKIIVTLGRFSMAYFLPNARISDVHGKAMNVKGRLIVAMYHPAAALHQQSLKATIEADFLRLPDLIARNRQLLSNQIEAEIKSTLDSPAALASSVIDPAVNSPDESSESTLPPNESPSGRKTEKEPKQLSLF